MRFSSSKLACLSILSLFRSCLATPNLVINFILLNKNLKLKITEPLLKAHFYNHKALCTTLKPAFCTRQQTRGAAPVLAGANSASDFLSLKELLLCMTDKLLQFVICWGR